MPQQPTFIFETAEAAEQWEKLRPDERLELVRDCSWSLEEALLDIHDGLRPRPLAERR